MPIEGGLMNEGLAELELELRMLPGVVAVGLAATEPAAPLSVSVVALDPEPDLERVATRVTRSFRATASVEILDLTPADRAPRPPARVHTDERVALVESTVDQASGQARIVLSWMGNSVTATASAGALIGPAVATLQALDGLGMDISASLSSVSSGQHMNNPPVRVVLRSDHDETEFVGIARAATEAESAARATLAAFNRYVGGRKVELN